MNRRNEPRLVTPLLHPPLMPDESPLGYLIRVADLNQYTAISWLNDKNSKLIGAYTPHNIYPFLATAEWTGCNLDSPEIREILGLNTDIFVSKNIRFCPLCVKETGYYQMIWQFKVSVACLKHKVWLEDACYDCENFVSPSHPKIFECACGADHTDVEPEPTSEEVIAMQRFFEGNIEESENINSVFYGDHGLIKYERIKLLNFFSRWLRRRSVAKSGINTSLREMSLAKDNMSDVAEALFTGHAGYHNFLRRLHKLGAGTDGIEVFTKFYRAFYNEFSQPCLQMHKDYLEQYMNKYWEKPLTRRNINFDEKTIESHPWIPFQAACRYFDLHKSQLKSALSKGIIYSKESSSDSRKFTLVYKPDLEEKLYRIKDLICAKESAAILGLSKAQFSALRDSGCFDVMIEPGSFKNSAWQFSRDEMYHYKEMFLGGLLETSGDYWGLPEVLKFYGGQIDNSLVTILEAIQSGDLKVKARANDLAGISSMLFAKDDFREWYLVYRNSNTNLSVPRLAKFLSIQQEFAYQLIDTGLMKTNEESDGSKSISKELLDDFFDKYVLLSKLAKKLNLSSSYLVQHFASREIYPVDHEWETKLRQKVYEKELLANIQLVEDCIV